MGATVTTGKKSFSIKHNGRDVFFLFEKTYEKNCYPHSPNWGCVAIGYYEDVQRYVFRAASACEGGSLQSRAGHYKPENYISAWLVAIRKSCVMPDLDLAISADSEGRESFYNTIPLAFREASLSVFAEHGLEDVVVALVSPGYCSVRLSAAIGLVLALFGVRKSGEANGIAPWRLMRDFSPEAHRALADVVLPGANGQSFENPTTKFYRVGSEDIFSAGEDGCCRQEGWAYSVVGKYIENVALKAELALPGSSKARIAAYRATVVAARPLPEGTLITITQPLKSAAEDGEDQRYQRRNAAHLFGLLQKVPGAVAHGEQVSLCYREILGADNASNILYYMTMDLGVFSRIKLPEVTAKNEPIKMQLEMAGF